MIYRKLTEVQYHEGIVRLLYKLKRVKFDFVYGIPRGGLIPAVYISHYFDKPLIVERTSEPCLIVDDIADTGKTRENNLFQNSIFATILRKPQSTHVPDYYVWDCPNDVWVVFPYESLERREVIIE